ncbi:replication protein [Anaerocolumna sp.]|uniref:replication protein n=1 Tax=Anaerocolumna sp. TaxID=2041569 RepID=UPI0028A9717F|nr:replication protein [Anaerocolumna sp.]
MAKDTQSRKWQLTINNPLEHGFTHEVIKDRLLTLKSLIYWVMSDEIGEKKTYHTHFYMAFSSAVRFSTLKNLFPPAHFEMAKGTSQANKDYVFKEGKWAKDKKKETNLPDTHEEFGEMPVERQGHRTDIEDLYDMIKDGMSNFEILETAPNYMMNIERVEKVRQILREERYKNEFRRLDVRYIYGNTGVGKTRGIMEMYGYQNVFRVTDYEHPWDNYKGQDIIIFEEFRSSLRIQDMLNYLDGYPLELPCRYANKVACYTKVYLITNIPLNRQFEGIQKDCEETWNAFLRRINRVICMKEKQSDIFTVEQYFSKDTDFISVEYIQEQIPFNI